MNRLYGSAVAVGCIVATLGLSACGSDDGDSGESRAEALANLQLTLEAANLKSQMGGRDPCRPAQEGTGRGQGGSRRSGPGTVVHA